MGDLKDIGISSDRIMQVVVALTVNLKKNEFAGVVGTAIQAYADKHNLNTKEFLEELSDAMEATSLLMKLFDRIEQAENEDAVEEDV